MGKRKSVPSLNSGHRQIPRHGTLAAFVPRNGLACFPVLSDHPPACCSCDFVDFFVDQVTPLHGQCVQSPADSISSAPMWHLVQLGIPLLLSPRYCTCIAFLSCHPV